MKFEKWDNSLLRLGYIISVCTNNQITIQIALNSLSVITSFII